jgi:hypothetical protein
MITASTVHERLQNIRSLFPSGHPPIHIIGLAQELQLPTEQLVPLLSELEGKGAIKIVDELIMLVDKKK